MYPKFIEVHDETRYCVNVNEITYIHDCGDDEDCHFKAYIGISSGAEYGVDETYDEVKQLITDSGCLIKKADPRLDDSPLTMEQLQKMVGEPVWNSNTRKWYIIHSVGNTVAMANPSEQSMLVYIKSDLSKYPLYRMKVTE